MDENEAIEDPWAVYHDRMIPRGFGRIILERKDNSLLIKYNKCGLPEGIWEPVYVRRFATPGEAADYYASHSTLSRQQARERFFLRYADEGESLEDYFKTTY